MSDDIGKLADEVIGRMKTADELKSVPCEMYARVLARAERAEAELAQHKLDYEYNGADVDILNDKIERAEAERNAMREALMPFAEAASEISPNMRDDLRVPYWARPKAGDLRKARAVALAASPAEREG